MSRRHEVLDGEGGRGSYNGCARQYGSTAVLPPFSFVCVFSMYGSRRCRRYRRFCCPLLLCAFLFLPIKGGINSRQRNPIRSPSCSCSSFMSFPALVSTTTGATILQGQIRRARSDPQRFRGQVRGGRCGCSSIEAALGGGVVTAKRG